MPLLRYCKQINVSLFLLSVEVVALAGSQQDLGTISRGILGPVQQISHLIQIICAICGVVFIAGSLMKYKAHRNNPQAVPLSTPLMLLLFGLGLLALAFIPQLILTKQVKAQ